MNVKHRAVATVPVIEPAEPEPVNAEYVEPALVDDGLTGELTRAEPRRWRNRATPWLVAVLLLVVGFATGAQIQKTYGPDRAGGAGANRGGSPFGGRTGQFPGFGTGDAGPGGAVGGTGGASGAPGGAAGRGGPATSGTVKLVDGSTIYVQTGSGDVVTVRTTSGTAVAVPGKLGDLKPGDKVSVQGSQTGDGEVTASSVTGQH